jgi:trk system potassium uptake protein TrkA
MVCIANDFGVSVKISALLKKLGVKKIISRESSSIHLTVLNSLGVKNTINPEWESARVLAQLLTLPGIHNLFSITETLKIVDLTVPEFMVGEKFSPIAFKEHTHLKIVALKRDNKILYSSSQPREDLEISDLVYLPDDILVLIGEIKDIRKFIRG